MASERFKLEIHLIQLTLKLVGIPKVGGFMLVNTLLFNYHKTLNIDQNQTERISEDLTCSNS